MEFTQEDADKVLPILSDIGAEEYRRVRGAIPTNLTDVLIKELKPSVRTKLAKKLIELALEGSGNLSLNAIREIWDRVEGKSRQTTVTTRASDDPLVSILTKVFEQETRVIPEAEFKVLDAGQES